MTNIHDSAPVQPTACPLCTNKETSYYFSDNRREYLHCPVCDLVFVPPRFHLDNVAEKNVYELHRNDIQDPGYRRFLSRLTAPLLQRLIPNQLGLDFGCGPGPALAVMLEEEGHSISLYDPYFHDTPKILDYSYDFITATEVVEHFASPEHEFKRFFMILKNGGTLGLMTKMVLSPAAFSRWHYIQDQTHICFYSRKSFEYIAGKNNADLEFIGNDVILMRKKQIST